MAVGEVYRLKLSGNMYGETCLNIFHYKNLNTDLIASQLGVYVRDLQLPFIADCLSNIFTFTDIEIQNLDDSLDFWVGAFSTPGNRSGDPINAFDTYGFTLNPSQIDQRSGGKRFSGVSESDVSLGEPTLVQKGRLQTAAMQMALQIVIAGGVFRPCLESIRCNKGLDGKCNGTFKSPTYPIVNSVTWKWLTTQNSRKTGQGI